MGHPGSLRSALGLLTCQDSSTALYLILFVSYWILFKEDPPPPMPRLYKLQAHKARVHP